MNIMFNQPVLLNNPRVKQNNSKTAFQQQLKTLEKDTVQFSGKVVSNEIYDLVEKELKTVPENSKTKIFLNAYKNILDHPQIRGNDQDTALIYVREIENEYQQKVNNILEKAIEIIDISLIKNLSKILKNDLGKGSL